MKSPPFDWLIIVVIHDFDEPEVNEIVDNILREFTTAGCRNRNKVLLVHDKIHVTDNNNYQFKTFFKTLKLKSENSDDPLEFNFIDIDETVVDFNYHDQRAWQKLLAWINKCYKSRRTILITLSHGAGIGINGPKGSANPGFTINKTSKRIIPLDHLHKDTLTNLHQLSELKSNFQLTSNYLIYDVDKDEKVCKKIEMLWISELADAIKKGFRKRKVDIAMLSNCYMQTFETGWLLRKNVRYLVAPQTVFKAYGYSFSSLLHTINKEPKIEPKELLKTVIPNFLLKMESDNIESKHLKMVSVVITSLRNYGVLKFLFEKISGILARCSDTELDKIAKLRQTIQNSSDYPLNDRTKVEGNPIYYEFIDFIHLLKKLNGVLRLDLIFRIYSYFFQKISASSIIDRYVGDDYITHDMFINRKFCLHGISIFMPRNSTTNKKAKITNCAYFGTNDILINVDEPNIPLEAFVKTSLWDEFIKKYITRLSNTTNRN